MKVGVDLGNQRAEFGGGYTFANEILESLLKLRSVNTILFFLWYSLVPTKIITNISENWQMSWTYLHKSISWDLYRKKICFRFIAKHSRLHT